MPPLNLLSSHTCVTYYCHICNRRPLQRAEGEGIFELCLEAQAHAVTVPGGTGGTAPPPGSEVAAAKALRWVRLARTTLQATQV